MPTEPQWKEELRELERRLVALEDKYHLQNEALLVKAVHSSQKEVFAKFGVNIDDAVALQDFQQGLLFARNIRRSVNKGIGAILLAVCGMIGTAVTMWFWETINRGP